MFGFFRFGQMSSMPSIWGRFLRDSLRFRCQTWRRGANAYDDQWTMPNGKFSSQGGLFKPVDLDIIGFDEAPDGDWTKRVGKVLGMERSYVGKISDCKKKIQRPGIPLLRSKP